MLDFCIFMSYSIAPEINRHHEQPLIGRLRHGYACSAWYEPRRLVEMLLAMLGMCADFLLTHCISAVDHIIQLFLAWHFESRKSTYIDKNALIFRGLLDSRNLGDVIPSYLILVSNIDIGDLSPGTEYCRQDFNRDSMIGRCWPVALSSLVAH